MTDPLELGKAAAAQLGSGDWQLDDVDAPAEPEAAPDPVVPPAPPARAPQPVEAATQDAEGPPSPEQLIEAILFVGGHPLTPEIARSVIRGLTPDRFQQAIDTLNRRYRLQQHPYAIEPRDGGYVLAVLPRYRHLRERLHGGPREARLSQPALDVLSVIAYRQPIAKADIDAIRGLDSGGPLRQLVRYGLIAVRHEAESGAREVRYGTTPRLLQLFGLNSLDELPRLGDTHQV